jgi:phytoene dehydrogenase-like protein
MVTRFWRPFLGGIFFDNELGTTDRLLTFVMRCLATGQNCLPAAGIGAVPAQLAAGLRPGTLRTGARVASLAQGAAGGAVVTLASGDVIEARCAVVLAVEGPEASRLAPEAMAASPSASGPGVGTVCVYFAADSAPKEPILYLNGDGRGRLVNNACVPSAVAPSYAPPGTALVSASLVGVPPPGDALDPRTPAGEAALAKAVLAELTDWFGADVTASFRHLKTYVVPFAQPSQAPPTVLQRPSRLAPWLFAAGDHREAATLDGALRSGRRAAEAVLEEMRAGK